MRKSDLFLLCFAFHVIFLLLLFTHASLERKADLKFLTDNREMVQRFGLTDLCLFTEASYTRHLSQADLHTAFQDHPMAFDYFPSGSIVMPPQKLREWNGKLD